MHPNLSATTNQHERAQLDASQRKKLTACYLQEATDEAIVDRIVKEGMQHIFQGAILFNADISFWNISSVLYIYRMFLNATSFNHNLCTWRDHFPYGRAFKAFQYTNCTFKDDPELEQRGPFCASSCMAYSPTSKPATLVAVSCEKLYHHTTHLFSVLS